MKKKSKNLKLKRQTNTDKKPKIHYQVYLPEDREPHPKDIDEIEY
ncbi:hypothetical protein [Texcoconibacillus texcoconensis]|uniref:Uncharacterized protein n=1 Tax=Texcoconibacillus texcoconensis TaxID=1095777 RepID=A0A840QQP1_9BACI|nr:hypothetical protein [Texcoconibacillus texcoconensis]MBB5173643.1 hypothetical protein [Texcoconibacillus texcoconensis]